MSKIYRIEFTECEHNEDLQNYKNDVINAGGTILISHSDFDDEIAYLKIEAEESFLDEFAKTESFQFAEVYDGKK